MAALLGAVLGEGVGSALLSTGMELATNLFGGLFQNLTGASQQMGCCGAPPMMPGMDGGNPIGGILQSLGGLLQGLGGILGGGGMPGMMPGGMPGMMQPMMPGMMQPMMPGMMQPMMPGMMPSMMPGMMPSMMPGAMPGMMPPMGFMPQSPAMDIGSMLSQGLPGLMSMLTNMLSGGGGAMNMANPYNLASLNGQIPATGGPGAYANDMAHAHMLHNIFTSGHAY